MEFLSYSLLQEFYASGTLSDTEVALYKKVKQRKIKDYVIEKMGSEPKFERKKKGDKFQEQYRYSLRVNGKQISFTGKSEEIVYQKVWDYFHTGIVPSNNNATLEEVFLEYFEIRKKDKSKSDGTFRNELIDWNRFLKNSNLAKMPIKSITVLDLKEFFAEITQRGLIKKKAARKPLSILNAVFRFAVPTYCEHNIASEINLNDFCFNMEEEDIYIYSEEEEKTLLGYIEKLPQTTYPLAIRLAFCFNMRIGELRALTWDDYNEEEGTIKVWHQIVYDNVDGKRTSVDRPFTKGKKKSGIRVLPVSDRAKNILAELRKINGNKHYILQGKNNAKFPISTDHFNEHLKKYCEACGVHYCPSHKIRFLGISKMYEAGIDESTIQRSAGHSTIDMTRHYNKDRRKLQVSKEVWNALF